MNESSAPSAPSNSAGVYLIDAAVYVFRAWHSLPESIVDGSGVAINALYGFAGFLGDLHRRVGPQARVAVAFDESLTTSFRNRIYADYKANRPPAPADLKRQFLACQALCTALGLAWHADAEYEADDIIGTWAAREAAQGRAVVIVSRDKDLAQLLGPQDVWWDFAADRRLDPAGVVDKLGVPPAQVAELLALTGDAVDNIPGVRGVGPKAAQALLARYATLEEIYADLHGVAALPLRGARGLAQKLEAGRELAFLSRELARIPNDCPRVPALPAEPPRARADAEDTLQALGLGGRVRGRLQGFFAPA